MRSLFTNFGKLVIFTLLGLGLVFAGYFAAQRFGDAQDKSITQTAAITTSPTPATEEESEQTVTGGASNYTQYSLTVPSDWKVNKTIEAEGITNKTILAKDGATLSIIQTARGGQPCSFEDVPFPTSSNPEVGPVGEQKYPTFTMFTGENNEVYRRVETQKGAEKVVYGVCAKNQEGLYFIPTQFGEFVYELSSADEALLVEMDKIVASIAKI